MPEDPSTVDSVRTSYDRVAGAYAQNIYGELEGKPFDRDLLTRFASATAGRGLVCDLGCGPGQIARFLRDAGADVFGLDLSPGMVEQARRLNPDIHSRAGNMLALELPDASLAGIAAFYAIVNLTPPQRAQAFAEMARVLQPGGLLLLAFHVGTEEMRPPELFGHSNQMTFYLLDPAQIRRELVEAGLRILQHIERDPYAPQVEHQTRRAYLLARKPEV